MSRNYFNNKKLFHYTLILIFSAINLLVNPLAVKAAAVATWDGKKINAYFKNDNYLEGDHGAMFIACNNQEYTAAILENDIYRDSDFIDTKTKKILPDQKARLLAYIKGYQSNEDDTSLNERKKDDYLKNYPSIATYTYCPAGQDKNRNRNVGGANFIMARALNKSPAERKAFADPSKKNDNLFKEFAAYINSPNVKVSWLKYKYNRNSSRGFVGTTPDWGFFIDTPSVRDVCDKNCKTYGVDTVAITINPEGSTGDQVLFALKASCGNYVYNNNYYENPEIYSWELTLTKPTVSPAIILPDKTTSVKWTHNAKLNSGKNPVAIKVYESDKNSPQKLTQIDTIGANEDTGNVFSTDKTYKNINLKAGEQVCKRTDITDNAFGYYVIKPSGTKQIIEGALNNEIHSGYSCVGTNSILDWSISLVTTLDNTTPNIGDEVTFTHKATVTSSSPLPFDVDVYFQNSIKGVLGDKVVLLTLPTGSGPSTSKSSTNKISITEAGDYCSQAISDKGNGTYIEGSNPVKTLTTESVSSIRKCANVNRTPSVGVTGGDLTVGKGISSSLVSKINVNNKSFVEYGVFSTGANMLMASGTTSPVDNANCEYSNLTFSNNKDGNTCGGDYIVNSLMRNYSSLFPTNSTISSDKTEVDLKDYIPGAYYKSLSYTGANLKIKSTQQITNSIVINAPDTTVTISENINRKKTNLTTSTIPQVVIIAKNIKISEAVTNIDAWLLSPNGYLTTCDSSATDNPQDSKVSTSKCNNNLYINGPIVTGRIYLLRTQTSDGPSETMSLPADTFIWEYNRSRQNTKYFHTTYTKELPPRL